MSALSLYGEKRPVTRDRIITFLMKRPSTIAALAGRLGVTQNAVRAQMALLEREGLVEVQGAVKGTRRPAAVYGIRPGAETQSSRAYPVVFPDLIRVLSKKLEDREFVAVMRELGKRIAAGAPPTAGDPRERVGSALAFLRTLGSVPEMTEEKGKIIVSSYGCPLARAVNADARSCVIMESLLTELTGLSVTERCDHHAHPSCRFEIRLPATRK